MAAPTLTIGNYSFNPVPSDINISREFVRTGSGTPINSIFTATLNGKLMFDNCNDIGIPNIIDQQALMQGELGDCTDCA